MCFSKTIHCFQGVSKLLESVVGNDQCFVYFDDLVGGAMDESSLMDNLEHIFVGIEKLGFKLSIEKCQFGIREIKSLGHTIMEQHGLCSNHEKLKSF